MLLQWVSVYIHSNEVLVSFGQNCKFNQIHKIILLLVMFSQGYLLKPAFQIYSVCMNAYFIKDLEMSKCYMNVLTCQNNIHTH